MMAPEKQYHQRGYEVLSGALSKDDVTRLRSDLAGLEEQTKDCLQTFLSCETLAKDSFWRGFVARPDLASMAKLELGDTVRHFHSAFVVKWPDAATSVIDFHRDCDFHCLDPVRTSSFWIPLDECNAKNGALQVIPGSHLNYRCERLGRSDRHNVMKSELSGAVRTETLEVSPGDAIRVHQALLHGSDTNRSDKPRRAFLVRYCSSNCRIDYENMKRKNPEFHFAV